VGRDLPQQRWLGVILLAWIMLVLLGYYVWHKPVGWQQLTASGGAVADLTLAACVTALAGGIGRRVLDSPDLPVAQAVAIQSAFGLGLLALLLLALAAIGLLGSWSAWLTLLVGLAAFLPQTMAWLRAVRRAVVAIKPRGLAEKLFAGLSATLLLCQLLWALVPPTAWDTLMYHLALPQEYVRAGRLVFTPSNPYWGQPQAMEMLYALMISLRGLTAATALSWFTGIITLVGIVGLSMGLAREDPRCGVGAGWAAVAAVMAGSSFRNMLGNGYVDDIVALYGVGVILCLWRARETRNGSWIAWAAACLGLGVGVKLTAVVAALAFAPLAGWALFHVRRRTRAVLLSVVLLGATVAPWLVKNYAATGNPLYPNLLPTPWVDGPRMAYFAYLNLPDRGPALQDLMLPLAATWKGIEGAPGYATDIGPLLLCLAIPGLALNWSWRMGRVTGACLICAWMVMALGAWYSPLLQQTRLFFLVLPLGALAAGWGWQALATVRIGQVRARVVAGVLVSAVLFLGLAETTRSVAAANPVATLIGGQSQTQYLENALGGYEPAMRAVASLPPGSRTVFLWEPRGLYASPTAQADVWIDRWYLDRRAWGEPQAIVRSWRDAGFTHLLLWRSGADFERAHRLELNEADWAALDGLLSSLPAPLYSAGGYEIFALEANW
jgi:hypothetical protein